MIVVFEKSDEISIKKVKNWKTNFSEIHIKFSTKKKQWVEKKLRMEYLSIS